MPSSVANREPGFSDISAVERAADVLSAAISVLRERLPKSWDMQVQTEVATTGRRRVDAVVGLTAPDGQRLELLLEAKRTLNTRDVPIALEQAREGIDADDASPTPIVLVGRYLAPATRARIATTGAGYIDATGNIRVVADRPALFLSDRGADRDPWRGPGRPRGSLRGEPAARIVRALADFAPPYSVPELAKRAGASTGAAYRVIEFLEQEDLLTRQPYGPINDVRWRSLLMRWSEDYGFAQSNPVRSYLEPRGLQALTERLRDVKDLPYVLTGSLGAERLVPYAPARLAMLYVDDPDRAKQTLALRETDSGANVVIAAASYRAVFDRADIVDGLVLAAPSQLAVDLLTGPGRNPSEATALLDWMEANESGWRR